MTGLAAVLFDFDYTLADSSPGVVECMNAALAGLGLPPAQADRIRATIGVSLPEALRRLAGERPAAETEEFVRLFVHHADQVMADQIRVYPSVRPVVDELRLQGLSLGIVSTKFRRRIEAILQREGLDQAFAVVVGGEDVAAHKPDPGGLLLALARLDCSPPDALYVGDTATDAEAAGRAGIAFAAVLSGVTPREAFAEHPVIAVFADLRELPAWSAGRVAPPENGIERRT
jgi:phosphoglycolate phosphatase